MSVRTLFSLIKLAGPCFGVLRRRYSCNSRKRPQFLIGSKIPDSRFRKKVDQKMSARCELLNSRISVHTDMGKFRAKREICLLSREVSVPQAPKRMRGATFPEGVF